MPTVKWAEVHTVARSAQALRDKPDQSGDVFAAVFDSARRSIGSRVDRTVREQQRRVADEKKTDSAKSTEVAAAAEAKRKELKRSHDSKENGKAGRSGPVREEKNGRVKHESAESCKFDPAKGSSRMKGSAAAEQTLQNQAESEPKLLQQSDVENDLTESPSWVPPLAVDENPIETSAVTRPTESIVTEEPARPAVSETANPVAAMILDLLAADRGSEGCVDECGAPQAADTKAAQVSIQTTAADQAAQPMSAEGMQKAQELSMSVWQFLRGVGAHLEQVIETQGRASDRKQPGARLQQGVAGEPAGQTPGSRLTTSLLVAGLENGNPVHRQSQGQENRPSGEGSTSQASAGDAAKGAEGSAGHAGSGDEFRGLLELAGRVRDRIASPDPQTASTSIGRDLGGKGVSLNEARAMTDLADVVRANIGARHSSMTLRLDPPELGQLRVDVRMHGEELTLRLQADTLLGRDALQSRLNELRSSLEQHGFKLNQVQVELRVPQGTPADSHQDRMFQQPGHSDGQASHEPGWQGGAGGGSETSSESMNERSAFSQENASSGEEQDRVNRLAETGVDLVV